jgi:agmatine deiminase
VTWSDKAGQIINMAIRVVMTKPLINGAVLLPVYEDQYSRQAVGCLERLFPDRDILTLPARAILAGGGSLHCMTREIPHIGQTPSGQAS